MAVPKNLQASIFSKIFSYDRALQRDLGVVVFFVGSVEEEESMKELGDAFRQFEISSNIVNAGTLEGSLSPNSVVYLMPGADKTQVSQFCADNGILTVSGVADLAEQGQVSISIGVQDERPLIIVNLERLRAEGHDLSAEVLRLAKVIR